VILLDIYKTIMDGVERQICPADLEMLQTTRRQDHKRLLISECIIGEGDVSPDALEAQSRVPKTKGWRRLLAGWVGQNLLRMTSDAWWLWVPCRPCHRLRRNRCGGDGVAVCCLIVIEGGHGGTVAWGFGRR
jgi:hypothetical protein